MDYRLLLIFLKKKNSCSKCPQSDGEESPTAAVSFLFSYSINLLSHCDHRSVVQHNGVNAELV